MRKSKLVALVILFIGLCCIVSGSYFFVKAPSSTCSYDEVIPGNHELSIVRQDNKFGYIDNEGKVVISLDYKVSEAKDTLNYFQEKHGLIPIIKDKKYGLINKHNDILIPFKYDFISIVDSNRIITQDNGKYFLKDISNHIIDGPYEELESVNNSKILIARSNNNVKLLDKNGKTLMNVTSPNLISYTIDAKNNEVYFIVYSNDQYTLFKEKSGNINKIPLVFSNTNFYVYDDIIYITDETGSKLYGLDGKLLNEYSVTLAEPFKSGVSFFRDANYNIGVIDSDGNIIKEAIYSNLYYRNLDSDGFFVLSEIINNQKLYGLFDSQGNEIFPFQNLEILAVIGDDYVVCSKDEKIVILDFSGNIIRTYDSFDKITTNMYKVGLHNKFGIINNKLQLLLSMDYEWIYYNNSVLYVQKNDDFKTLTYDKINN